MLGAHLYDTRSRGSDPQPLDQLLHGFFRSAHQHFHTPVGQIASKALETEALRLLDGGSSVKDALNTARDPTSNAVQVNYSRGPARVSADSLQGLI